MVVYLVLEDRSSDSSPLGQAIDTFVRREDAERFIASVPRDHRKLAEQLRVVARASALYSDLLGELITFCPECSERDFGEDRP